MNFTQKLGRHACAIRDISVGELVLVERAVAAVPREQYTPLLCHWCFRKIPDVKMMVNGQDRVYCSHGCIQEAAKWGTAAPEVHSKVPTIARETDCDSALLRMVVELESLKERRPSGGVLSLKDTAEDVQGGQHEWWRNDKELPNHVLCAGWEDVRALVSHWEKMPESWRKSVTAASKALQGAMVKAYTKRDAGSLHELQELAATVNSNAHGIGQLTGDNADVALGLFPVLSLFNHSCRPNCSFHADGPLMSVRAVRDIKAGEQLCVSYINLFEPRWLRAKLLLETRFFLCCCQRCTEELSSSTDRLLEGVQCTKSKCSGLLLADRSRDVPEKINLWKCNVCGTTAGGKKLEDVSNEEGTLDEQNENRKSDNENPEMESIDPQECVDSAQRSLMDAMAVYQTHNTRKALQMLEAHIKNFDGRGKLAPMHVHLFDSWTPIMNCCRRLGDAHGSVKYCQKVIHAMEAILDIPTIELGNYYQCLGEMLSVRAGAVNLAPAIRDMHKKQAQDALRKVLNIRKISVGMQHGSTQEVLALLRKL